MSSRFQRPSLLHAVLAASLLALGACLDGPFARANPHDSAGGVALTIMGGADTVRVAGETVFFQLVTDPVTVDYTVTWTSSNSLRLASVGFGRFTVGSLPLAPSAVTITATIGGNSATRSVIVMPATP